MNWHNLSFCTKCMNKVKFKLILCTAWVLGPLSVPVIAFYDGYFSHLTPFLSYITGDNGGLCRKGTDKVFTWFKRFLWFHLLPLFWLWCKRTHRHLLSSGRQESHTHADISSGFHSSFNSSEMSHQPVTCCACSKQEWMMNYRIQLGDSSCHWG